MTPEDIVQIEKLFAWRADAPLWRKGESPHRRAELLKPRQFWTLLKETPVIYQPLGTIEYHERCSPLGTDTLKAWGVCLRAADISGGVVLPPIFWGIDLFRRRQPNEPIRRGMDSTAGFRLPGSTYQLRDETYYNLLVDVVEECFESGAELVVLLTGHNGPTQEHMVRRVAAEFNDETDREIVYATNDLELLRREEALPGGHGGLYEALMAEAFKPGIVDLDELPGDPEAHCCGGGFGREDFDPAGGNRFMNRAAELVAEQVRARLIA
jgi:creatinine amidohydrolase